MAIVREDGRYVNSLYIDEHYEGRSVLLPWVVTPCDMWLRATYKGDFIFKRLKYLSTIT